MVALTRRACLGGALVALALAMGCGGGGGVPRPGVQPLPAPRVVSGDLDGRVLLADTAARASQRGASSVSVVAAGPAVEGERVGAFVEVPDDACLLAYARASGTVEDVDVAAFTDEGNALAIDDRPDPRPTIIVCPPHPLRIFVAAHVVSGEGLVALGAHAVPRDRAGEIARALGAHGSSAEAPRHAEAWPGLDDRVRAHRAALGGRWDDVRKVAISVDARAPAFAALPVEADQCIDAVVVPDDDVSSLDVEARDGEGRVVARAREAGREKSITVCSPVAFAGSISIRPHVGSGLVALVLGRASGDAVREMASRPEVAWASATLAPEASRAALAGELGRAGYGAPTATATGTLSLGRKSTFRVDPGGATAPCARVDVLGAAPTAMLEAKAWDDTGALVGAGDGVTDAVLYVCSKGRVHVDVEARGRPGPVSVLVRREPWANAAWTATPLAASRMLGRAGEGPLAILEGSAAPGRAVTVDGTHKATWEELVPQGQCLRVIAGAEGEGSGLELRIADAAADEELDRAQGESSAVVRACAPSTQARRVRLELRAAAGKLSVVVGERLR
jgi:hypothetical protein